MNRNRNTVARGLGVLLLLAVTACATRPAPGPEPAAIGVAAPQPSPSELPPIPTVDGPLRLRVSYPRDSLYVATRDRTFIFGSAGSGAARVWINGGEVEVQPNGGFLAFLPVPEDGVYRLRATLGDETATLQVPVRLPDAPTPAEGVSIVPGSAFPSGGWVAHPGERIEAGFRGTPGGSAWIELPDGVRVPLVEDRSVAGGGATNFEVTPAGDAGSEAPPAVSLYRGFFTARRITSADTTVAWPALTGEPRTAPANAALAGRRERDAGAPGEAVPLPLGVPAEPPPVTAAAAGAVVGAADAPGPGSAATLVLAVAGETVRKPLPVNLLLADPRRPRVGVAHDPDPPERNGDGQVNARPGPGGGPYHYTWRNGTELELTGERNGAYRVRLTDDLDAWTAGDIDLRAPGTAPPDARVSTVRLDPQPGWIDVHVAVDRRVPYRVDGNERSLVLSVYGATSRINFLQHGRVDPYIERAEWSQPADRLFRLELHLASLPWGYEVFWGQGGDLVLRLKRPPAIDPARPLSGLTVGVDAGHGGSDRYTMGPTGFTEADANLGVARSLAAALERRGARVVLSRTSDSTVSLVERTTFAREQDVDLWVSTHNNAFPDGVNPWENNGTSVYYNHAPSAGLAWAVQKALLEELGLRDLGVGRADLHVARFTWAPAILTETAFMMIPEQEAFLRSPEGQERIAEAHARGIEAWLRELAGHDDR